MFIRRVSLPLAATALTACAVDIDIEAERTSLLETDKAWAAAASEGQDVDQIVSFWSDDATVLPPDAPAIKGKAAIRQFVAESMEIPGFSISWEPSEVVVSPSGDFGYTMGENAFTVPGPDGSLLTMRGRYLTVWRKAPDGSWECVMDIWNSGPEAQSMEAP